MPKLERILLVKPQLKRADFKLPVPQFRRAAPLVPLNLATLAALTPDDIEVDIWDETLYGQITEATDLSKDYDIVGVTGSFPISKRVRQLGSLFRERGTLAVVGGPGVSSEPELYREHFDVLFVGEAEYTWPQFIADFRSGRHRRFYRQVAWVDMADSPIPKWDALADDMKSYLFGGMQTTRGCPFDCEFCDVIHLFGRRFRHKPIERVLEEIRVLEGMGFRIVGIADDNFYGNPRYTKELLRALIPLNRSFRRPLMFYTGVSLNIAEDEEVLELLVEANVRGLGIGIETPNKESLKETHKLQNYRVDMVEAVKKIHKYGLIVNASMIVGFDHDDASIFQQQLEFIQGACIPTVGIHLLKAPKGTKLWVRLHKENRLFHQPRLGDTAGSRLWCVTNVIPKQMTLVQLLSGHRDLLKEVYKWDNFQARLEGMISRVQRRPAATSRRPSLGALIRALRLALKRLSNRELRRRPAATSRRPSLGALIRALRLALKRLSNRELRSEIWRFITDKHVWRAIRHCLPPAVRRGGPFVAKGVLVQIVRNYITVTYGLPAMFQDIEEEIHRVSDQDALLREKMPFFVPDSFRKPYKEIFPELHARVYRELVDKSRTENALVEVVYDFLTRWGPTFQQFEDFHWNYLQELCDRTISKENCSVPEHEPLSPAEGAAVEGVKADEEVPDVRHQQRLADEVLRCVQEELRSFQLVSQT